MTLVTLWGLCGLLIPALHLLAALIVDRRIALGTWTRAGLVLFMLLGPFGLLLEVWLLASVFSDLAAALRGEPRSAQNHRGPAPYPQRPSLARTSGRI